MMGTITKKFVAISITLIVVITTVRCNVLWQKDEIKRSKLQVHNEERSLDGNHEGRDQALFCAVTNPTSGSYIDLSQLSTTPNKSGDNDKKSQRDYPSSWLARGWGYDGNFTLGICSSPTTEKEQQSLSNMTGAFYQNSLEQLVSIGDFSTSPTLLGNKKLVMRYENGSMCPNGKDRKSTLLNFVCDKEISAKAQFFYIGSLHDCTYFFEVRSVFACPTSNTTNEVNVLGIFVGIFAVFFIVEFAGRRWLYEKVRNHFDAKNNSLSATPLRPRWDLIENESSWKYGLKKAGRITSLVIRGITSMILRMTGRTATSSTRRGSIRLNSSSMIDGSQQAFIRDMEQQNNIIDSLEVASHQSSIIGFDRRE